MCNENCSRQKDQDFVRCCECVIWANCDIISCLAFGDEVECRKIQSASEQAKALAKSLGLDEISDNEMDVLVKDMLKKNYGIER
ncbi:MAG: hypothetical protein ACFFDB_00520 [Promethearchaeota archaeon]